MPRRAIAVIGQGAPDEGAGRRRRAGRGAAARPGRRDGGDRRARRGDGCGRRRRAGRRRLRDRDPAGHRPRSRARGRRRRLQRRGRGPRPGRRRVGRRGDRRRAAAGGRSPRSGWRASWAAPSCCWSRGASPSPAQRPGRRPVRPRPARRPPCAWRSRRPDRRSAAHPHPRLRRRPPRLGPPDGAPGRRRRRSTCPGTPTAPRSTGWRTSPAPWRRPSSRWRGPARSSATRWAAPSRSSSPAAARPWSTASS